MNLTRIFPVLILLSVEYTGVFLAVIADLVSGLRKSRSRGEPCTSWGLRRSVDKLLRYYLALLALTLVDFMAIAAFILLHDSGSLSLPEFPFLTTFGALSLALIEVKSICEKAEDKGDLRRAATLLSDLLSRFPTGLFSRRK